MARIRTIKPKFWDDIKIGRISRDARLLYIGMWTFCDDLGVIIAEPIWLKSKIFPYDQIQIQQFEKICSELLRNGFISLFSYNDEKFYYLPKFSRHQVINKPNYDEVYIRKELLFSNIDIITEQSRNNHGLITEQYVPIIGEEKDNNIPPIIPQSEIRTEGNIQTENKHRLNVDFVKDEFKNVFLSWIEYKHERKESYKSERSLKACYNRLLKLSNNNPEVANSIIEQSIANNWAGFFELYNHKNETAGRKEPCGQSSKRYRKLD